MNYKVTRLDPFGVLLEPKNQNTYIIDIDVENLRQLFHKEQLLLLRGFKSFKDADDFSNYCDSWGEIALWPFGKVLELIKHDNPEDHIFDHSYVPLHWDGMYRPQIPEYQIFHCVKAPLKGQGGRTTFSNTILVLKNSASEDLSFWKNVTASYERKMEFYHSKIVSALVTKHPYKDYYVIRYNEAPSIEKGDFINPPLIKFSGVNDLERGLFEKKLSQALYHEKNFYAHEWQNGDVVIADNFSLLHGREKFSAESPRHLRRVQVLSNPPINNSELESYK